MTMLSKLPLQVVFLRVVRSLASLGYIGYNGAYPDESFLFFGDPVESSSSDNHTCEIKKVTSTILCR